MTAITNRFAPAALNLPASQAPASRASATPAAKANKPADVVELAKVRAASKDPMLDLEAAPMLPSSGSAPALPRDFGERLEVYREEMGAGALAWGALMEMARSATNDIRVAAEVRSAMQRGAIDAKLGEINKAERQQAHERSASLQNLGTTVAVQAVAVIVGGMLGTALSNSSGALSNAAQQNIGPGRKAQAEKLEQMHQELTRTLYEQNIDSAKTSYEEAKEQMKLAMRILSEHAERKTQISSTITRV